MSSECVQQLIEGACGVSGRTSTFHWVHGEVLVLQTARMLSSALVVHATRPSPDPALPSTLFDADVSILPYQPHKRHSHTAVLFLTSELLTVCQHH